MPYLDEGIGKVDFAVQHFREAGWVGQIVGRHGSGKTTFCFAMAGRLNDEFGGCQFVTCRSLKDVRVAFSRLESEGEQRLLVIDGLERLSFVQQQLLIANVRASRKLGGLLLTSHQPIRFVKTLADVTPSLEILESVVEYLAPGNLVPHEQVERAFRVSNENVRESLMILFDWFEAR